MMPEDNVPASCESTPHSRIAKDTILEGPHWPEPISVVTHIQSSHGFVIVEAVGLDTRKHYTTTLVEPLHVTSGAPHPGQ
jgi:hypothetical protein